MTIQPDAWSELLDIVAHDLKTPITAVKGYIDLIQHAGPLNERQQLFAERAVSGLKRMEQLVTMLLDVTWIDTEKPVDWGECDLRWMIDEAVRLMESLATKRNITLQVNHPSNPGVVMGDMRRLSQVIYNLLSNAIKYNRDGGLVEISSAGDTDWLSISVRDTGIGIPEDEQDKIFERFFRARTGRSIEGTGLGLAIVKAIVERHGGSVRVESMPDVGSVFTFVLPRRPYSAEGMVDSDQGDPWWTLEVGESRANLSLPTESSEISDSLDDNLQESEEIEPDQDNERI